MPILLLLLWMVFNGRFTADVIISGVVVTAMLTWFLARFTGWSVSRDGKFAARIPAFLIYVVRLFLEVIRANVHMIALVLSADPEAKIHPRIVKHETPLQTGVGRVALANSITLTPGTITVDVGDKCVYVHAIDDNSREGLQGSALEKKLINMERVL